MNKVKNYIIETIKLLQNFMKNLSIFFKNNKSKIINKFLKKIFLIKKNTGPEILRNNLIRGLKQNLISININPNIRDIFRNCLILDDVDALKKIINLKKNKKNIKIIAGPNLMIMPDEYNKVLYKKEINKIIVPCKWVKKKYLEVSKNKLKNKLSIWPSGVDHNYWKPGKNKKIDFLIYSKFIKNNEIFNQCIDYLKTKKFKIKVLKYGGYNAGKYLNLLKQTKNAVFFSQSESQGLAYFEAWSTNVPTLVYNPNEKYRSSYKTKAHSCPYLNKKLGDEFKTFSAFKIKLKLFLKNKSFNPRSEILNKYTLNKAAKKLIKII